jgi:hypothetical protein
MPVTESYVSLADIEQLVRSGKTSKSSTASRATTSRGRAGTDDRRGHPDKMATFPGDARAMLRANDVMTDSCRTTFTAQPSSTTFTSTVPRGHSSCTLMKAWLESWSKLKGDADGTNLGMPRRRSIAERMQQLEERIATLEAERDAAG